MSADPMMPGTELAVLFQPYRHLVHRVTNDAMEPAVRPGDFLVADITQDEVSADGLYLVCRNGLIQPRRVQRLSSGIRLSCDNPHWPDAELLSDGKVAELTAILRVVAHLKAA